MNRKFSIFINENGEKVAVYAKPIAGQLRYVESKRTALDGEKKWGILDNWINGFVYGFYFNTKKECRATIERFLKKGYYLEQKHLNGGQEKKTKKYAVDVHCDLAKCFVVEAASQKDAEDKVWKKIRKILAQPNPHPLNDLVAEGFETTDDAEVTCSGEEDKNGEIQYF
jgi:hypothetical protein